jgi:hypothetical protein
MKSTDLPRFTASPASRFTCSPFDMRPYPRAMPPLARSAGDMVVVADLGTAHAAKEFLRPIGASAVEAVRLLMVDALHFEAAMKCIPGR